MTTKEKAKARAEGLRRPSLQRQERAEIRKGRQQRRQKREKAKRRKVARFRKRPQHNLGTHTQRRRVGTLGKENRPRTDRKVGHCKDASGGALRVIEGSGNLIARGTSVCYAARESSPVEGVSNGIL